VSDTQEVREEGHDWHDFIPVAIGAGIGIAAIAAAILSR
jgi:hypothetical protein